MDRAPSCRCAFTLLELLVIIAIVGVMVGLLIPAIQMANEAVNRMTCAVNLRQVVTAMHGYHEAQGFLPPGSQSTPKVSSMYSVFVSLMPFMEENQRVNDSHWWNDDNLGDMPQDIPWLRCPCEARGAQEMEFGGGWSNYSVNVGSWLFATRKWDGVFGPDSKSVITPGNPTYFNPAGRMAPLRLTDITGELSQTTAFAEVAVALPSNAGNGRYQLNEDLHRTPNDVVTEQQYLLGKDWCGAQEENQRRGAWFSGMPFDTFYNHILPPNSPTWIRYWGNDLGTVKDFIAAEYESVQPASSMHPNGVNAAFCDGSVRFVKDGIDAGVWLTIGMRTKSQSVALPD